MRKIKFILLGFLLILTSCAPINNKYNTDKESQRFQITNESYSSNNGNGARLYIQVVKDTETCILYLGTATYASSLTLTPWLDEKGNPIRDCNR